MGVDYDVRLFYGWMLSGRRVSRWLQSNDLSYDGKIYGKEGPYEPWPDGVELGHTSPQQDASDDSCDFCVYVLGRSDHYHAAMTTLAELAAIPVERIEAARRMVLLIDPRHEAGAGAPPELWALPHIW